MFVFDPPMIRLGSVRAACGGVLSVRPYTAICELFSSCKLISFLFTSTATELNPLYASLTVRVGARCKRVVCLVAADAAGAGAPVCRSCAVSRPFVKRSRANAKAEGIMKRKALFIYVAPFLCRCRLCLTGGGHRPPLQRGKAHSINACSNQKQFEAIAAFFVLSPALNRLEV